MGGSASSASPGGTNRFGPMNANGDARGPKCGSSSTLRPPICSRKLACPIQVMRISPAAARGRATSLATSGSRDGSGLGGSFDRIRSICQRSTLPPARVALQRPRDAVLAVRTVVGGALGHEGSECMGFISRDRRPAGSG